MKMCALAFLWYCLTFHCHIFTSGPVTSWVPFLSPSDALITTRPMLPLSSRMILVAIIGPLFETWADQTTRNQKADILIGLSVLSNGSTLDLALSKVLKDFSKNYYFSYIATRSECRVPYRRSFVRL